MNSSSEKETGLTPQEAGDLIGCSAYTIKELARGGRIPFYKVGSMYRFTHSALMEWVNEQEIKNYKKGELGNGKH